MDAMVTARMSQGKKELGNQTLTRLGTNASAVINSLYDFVIANDSLPFPAAPNLSKKEIARRITFVDSISLAPDNRFSQMTDDQIKQERLAI